MEAAGLTELEVALMRAVDNAEARPAFYNILLESRVLVLADSRSRREGNQCSLVAWCRDDGVRVIPFFSSVSALPPRQQGLEILKMPVRGLLEATRGMHLHLNPVSPHGRGFSPDEVDSLLSTGGIHERRPPDFE